MKRITLLLIGLMLLFTIAACGTSQESGVDLVQGTTTAPAEVVRLEMVCPPDKTDYLLGERFDPTGLVLNAVMSDGTVAEDVDWTPEENPYLGLGTLGVNIYYGGKAYMQPVTVIHAGNAPEYAASNVPLVADSPLSGKVYFWLGSSVTLGASAMNESMADFIAQKYACTSIKEAVSGTTLAAYKENSYVERWNTYLASPDRAAHLDALICQLSTNDQKKPESFGKVTADDVRDPGAFDVETTFGAMEYIIATAQKTWGCPVVFYTNPPTGDENYRTLVLGLYEIASKWNVTIIDMNLDLSFNAQPTEEQRSLWMVDKIHPSRAGYRDWWLPKFEEALLNLE